MPSSMVSAGSGRIGPSMYCCLIIEAQASGRATHWRVAIQAASTPAGGIMVTERRPSKQTDALPEIPIVIVDDDDPEVREALSGLFRSVGLEPRLFGSTAEFLQHELPEAPCCVVLDVRLPGVGGLDFQAQLIKANIHVPIVMVTGHG